MGYKSVCLDCQKAYNMGTDFSQLRERICPDCGKTMIQVSHLFKPPQKDDNKQWEMVKYLIDNGFYFTMLTNIKKKAYG